jgi:hypothetical protein
VYFVYGTRHTVVQESCQKYNIAFIRAPLQSAVKLEKSNIESRPLETDAFCSLFSEYPYYGNVAETLLLMALFTIWFKSYGRGSVE